MLIPMFNLIYKIDYYYDYAYCYEAGMVVKNCLHVKQNDI